MESSQTTATNAAGVSSNNPLMPPAKQQRILIWRTEVASALSLPTSSHSSDTTTTSIASPLPDDMMTINDDAMRPTPEQAMLGSPLSPTTSSSKARSLWKRISWRFSRHRRAPSSLAPDAQRTSMYRNDRPVAMADEDEDAAFPDRNSDSGGAANGLRDKQDRMQRAARLLNQGLGEDEGAAVLNAQRSRDAQHTVA